jgi:hypothetical protein
MTAEIPRRGPSKGSGGRPRAKERCDCGRYTRAHAERRGHKCGRVLAQAVIGKFSKAQLKLQQAMADMEAAHKELERVRSRSAVPKSL